MGKRIRALFHQGKINKTYKYYKKLVWLISATIGINILILLAFSVFFFKSDIENYFSKIEDSILNIDKKGTDLVKKDFIFFKVQHDPFMFAGHSISGKLNNNMLNRETHSVLFNKTGGYAISQKPNCANENGYYGIDVSIWQNCINWDQVHVDTIPHRNKFFIIKATQGLEHVDPYFAYNWDKAKQGNSITGAYHFFIYKDDPKLQAENFIKTVELDDGDLLPIVDVELNCSGCTGPDIPIKDLLDNLKIYIETIEEHFRVKPIIYTYTYFYETYLKGHFDYCAFWIAEFSGSPPKGMIFSGSGQQPVDPLIAMWQFSNSESINGIIGKVDMSYIPASFLDSVLIRK